VQTCVGIETFLVEHFDQIVDARLGAVHFPVSADEELSLCSHPALPSDYQESKHHTPETPHQSTQSQAQLPG